MPQSPEAEVSSTFYIAGLPVQLTEPQLSDLVSSYGKPVSVKMIRLRVAADHRVGIGIVQMSTRQEADRAIHALDARKVSGHYLYACWRLESAVTAAFTRSTGYEH